MWKWMSDIARWSTASDLDGILDMIQIIMRKAHESSMTLQGTSYCNRRMNSSEEWSWVWLEFIKEFRDSSKKNSWKQSAMMRNPSVSLELIRHWSSTLSQGESPSVLNRQTDLETFDSSLGRASFEIHSRFIRLNSRRQAPIGTRLSRLVNHWDQWNRWIHGNRWKIAERSLKNHRSYWNPWKSLKIILAADHVVCK